MGNLAGVAGRLLLLERVHQFDRGVKALRVPCRCTAFTPSVVARWVMPVPGPPMALQESALHLSLSFAPLFLRIAP